MPANVVSLAVPLLNETYRPDGISRPQDLTDKRSRYYTGTSTIASGFSMPRKSLSSSTSRRRPEHVVACRSPSRSVHTFSCSDRRAPRWSSAVEPGLVFVDKMPRRQRRRRRLCGCNIRCHTARLRDQSTNEKKMPQHTLLTC